MKWYIALIIIISAIFITINYDIYSYHIWAYNGNHFSISELYNNENYFDRFADYPPLGVYIYIITGKLISFIKPLSISYIPFLFLYKLFPLIAFFILIYLLKPFIIKNRIELFVLFSMGLFTALTAQNDIIVLLLLFMGIKMLKHNDTAGIFMLLLSVFIKQTAFFFAVFIILVYLYKNNFKYSIFIKTFIIGVFLFFIIFSPFILKGNILNTIHTLFVNTVSMSSPLSADAFNMLDIIPKASLIDYNYKLFNIVSIKTLSLLFVFISIVLIILILGKKKSIFHLTLIFALIWYNIMVGLRNQHIIYPLFFLIFLIDCKRIKWNIIIYCILFLLNIFLTNSIITMRLFHIPYIHNMYIIIFSLIQLVITIDLLHKIINYNKENIYYSKYYFNINVKYAIILLVVFIFLLYIPGRVHKNENEFFSFLIKNNYIIDYSKDKYIELDVISRSPFNNYLGLRLSDNAWFYFIKHNIYSIEFRYSTEYIDRGKISFNDKTFSVYSQEQRGELLFEENTVFVKSKTNAKYSNIAIYDIHFKEIANE